MNNLETSQILSYLTKIDQRLDTLEGQVMKEVNSRPNIQDQSKDQRAKTETKSSSNLESKTKFTKEKKLNIVIEAIQERNNSKIARKYKIDESTVRKWRLEFKENKECLDIEKSKKWNKGVREGKFPEMEQALVLWIANQRDQKLPVRMSDICEKAQQIFEELYPLLKREFNSSHGWFCRFVKRAKLSRRAPTHIIQKMTETSLEEIQEYLKNIFDKRVQIEVYRSLGEFTSTLIINIDEVPMTMDFSSKMTYEQKGATMVEVKKSAGTRQTFTALLGILSNGFKLPPYIVFKTKNATEVPEDLRPYIIVRRNSRGWMNGDLFLDYIKRLLLNLRVQNNTHIILTMDQSRIHKVQPVIDALNCCKYLSHFFIPAGCTFLLQPLDISCNKPLKDRLRDRFHEWFQVNGIQPTNITPAGFYRPPRPQLIMRWLLEELEGFPTQIVVKSFKICGSSNELDHSEDYLINPKISDHFGIENMHRTNLFRNEDPYHDQDTLIEQLKSQPFTITFEQTTEEPFYEESSSESSISEEEEIPENGDPCFEPFDKVRVCTGPSRIKVPTNNHQIQEPENIFDIICSKGF